MKRINPDTGREFVKGDAREDGKVFLRYNTLKPLKKNGNYIEVWSHQNFIKSGIKRLNPITQKIFKRGDVSPDTGKLFWIYSSLRSDINGFAYENWLTQEKFQANRKKYNKSGLKHKKKIRLINNSPSAKRRLNPITGQVFKRGDKDEMGMIFSNYTRSERNGDFIGESWLTEKSYLRKMMSQTMKRAKDRAVEKKILFNLNLNFLESIFPKDYICPVLRIKMEWNNNNRNSPSLDRLIPELGYVEENVCWISNKANVMKKNRTPDILRKIADWIDENNK